MQEPNSRSSHNSPKPSGGGIAFVFAITSIDLFLDNKFSLLCLPLAIVGFLDDVFILKKSIRYLSQFLTSILILYQSNIFDNNLNNLDPLLIIFIIFSLIIFITGIINFTNFMDGADGLICACLIIVFGVASIKLSPFLLIIVASLIGFLPWNWQESKVFMGDGGSTFLGALLAANLVKEFSYDSIKILAVSSPLFLDALICLLRRFSLNQPIFKAHNLHLFQRLYQSGMSHSKITLIYLFASSILGLFVVLDLNFLLIPSLVFIVSIGIYLDNYVAIPFRVSLDKKQSNFNHQDI